MGPDGRGHFLEGLGAAARTLSKRKATIVRGQNPAALRSEPSFGGGTPKLHAALLFRVFFGCEGQPHPTPPPQEEMVVDGTPRPEA